jgi:hypothetical protein
VLVHGFDIPLAQGDFFETVHTQAAIVADGLGKTLVPVRTNLRDILNGIEWPFYGAGPAMAAVGLALARLFHTALMAADRTFGELGSTTLGCHPALDPLWSTETLEFVHDGAETKRADKIPLIASSPLALRGLRVCFENPDGAYNCGRCSKCLNTMVLLDLYRVLNQTEQLPHRYDLRDIAAVDQPVGRFRRTLWVETLARVKAAGGPPELIRSIETSLARGARVFRRRWLRERAGRIFAGIGLTRARVLRLDQRTFGGWGMRLARAARPVRPRR